MNKTNQHIKSSRSYRFEASHQVVFEKANEIVGNKESEKHGHNFKLRIETDQKINAQTGLSIDLNELDRIAQGVIVGLDHVHFTRKFFATEHPITHEYLASHISRYITSQLGIDVTIILATDVLPYYQAENGWAPHKVIVEGGVFMKHAIYSERSYQFSATHNLVNPDLAEEHNSRIYGKCVRLHGHDYVLSVTVSGLPNENNGIVAPYKTMDEIIKDVLKEIDCKNLSEIEIMNGLIPTSENILLILWPILEKRIESELATALQAGKDIKLHELTLKETARNTFSYKG